MSDLLAVEGVVAGYGAGVVLEDVSLNLAEGESLALLGRNGVGKTTLLLTLMGMTSLERGAVRWRGEDISRMPPYARAAVGLGWVPINCTTGVRTLCSLPCEATNGMRTSTPPVGVTWNSLSLLLAASGTSSA